jgi:hypothetical protein
MRNSLSIAAAIALFLPGAAAASGLDAAFNIIRKGDRIGFHAVNVEATENGYQVETRIEMKVAFGPITLFHYSHDALEIWKDGALQSLTSRTDNNGRKMNLTVERAGDLLVVDGQDYQGEAPLSAIPSSYWNKAIVNTKYLLNTQTGALIEVTSRSLGETKTPSGAMAEQHLVNGSVALNLWYDDLRWVGADFVVRGEALSYKLIDEAARERLFAKLSLGDGVSAN